MYHNFCCTLGRVAGAIIGGSCTFFFLSFFFFFFPSISMSLGSSYWYDWYQGLNGLLSPIPIYRPVALLPPSPSLVSVSRNHLGWWSEWICRIHSILFSGARCLSLWGCYQTAAWETTSQKRLSLPQYHSMTRKSRVVWRRKAFVVNYLCQARLLVDHSQGQDGAAYGIMVVPQHNSDSEPTQTSIQGVEATAHQWGIDEESIVTIPDILWLKAAT